MKIFSCSRLHPFFLSLLVAIAPCIVSSRVRGMDLPSFDPAMVEPTPAAPVLAVPGTPISFPNPGGTVIVSGEASYSPDPEPISDHSTPDVTTAFPGDIIMLANPTGGDAPSNWAAALRFLNPADPTGSLNLDATEDEAFLARDMGPEGFANFSLFPNAMYATNTSSTDPDSYTASLSQFGPSDGVLDGQTAILIFTASDSAIPEPGTVALLALGATGLALKAARRLPFRPLGHCPR